MCHCQVWIFYNVINSGVNICRMRWSNFGWHFRWPKTGLSPTGVEMQKNPIKVLVIEFLLKDVQFSTWSWIILDLPKPEQKIKNWWTQPWWLVTTLQCFQLCGHDFKHRITYIRTICGSLALSTLSINAYIYVYSLLSSNQIEFQNSIVQKSCNLSTFLNRWSNDDGDPSFRVQERQRQPVSIDAHGYGLIILGSCTATRLCPSYY